MISFSIRPEIADIFPSIHIGMMTGHVCNTGYNDLLWDEINKTFNELRPGLSNESIRGIPFIQSGKDAYRKLGKDPNRYRVSAEALLRRIARGDDLYQINSLVDILNLVSVTTGVTIGGFDKQKISGEVSLGIGQENEHFEAIGRGRLNIHRLPVYRDQKGAVGSPTSDCVRTRITEATSEFLMIITGFFGEEGIADCLDLLKKLIGKYISGRDFEIEIKRLVS